MKIISRILSNGLTVVLSPMKGTQTLSGIFMLKAGTKYQADVSELAHFLEHMAFKGTKTRPRAIDITEPIEEVGGEINAFTSEDVIGYYIKTPSLYADILIDTLSDIILHPLLREEDIETERGPILSEFKNNKISPLDNLMHLVLPKLLFGENHPAAIRREKDIKSINREQLLSYYRDLFVAPNSIVCLAGKIPNPEYMFEKIESSFSELSSDRPKRKLALIQPQEDVRIKIVNRNIGHTLLALGIKCQSAKDPEKYALILLDDILGGRSSARLFQGIREKRGLSYSINSFLDLQNDIGFIIITADLDSKHCQEGLSLILNSCQKEVNEDELEKAKRSVLGKMAMRFENSMAVAREIALSWAIEEKIIDIDEEKNKINKVTHKEVEEIVKTIMKKENICIALSGPHKGEEENIRNIVTSSLPN